VIAILLLACAKDCDEPGVICSVMGTGDAGLALAGAAAVDEPLYWPADVTIGPDGNPWLPDWNNHRLITLPDQDGTRRVRVVTGNVMVGDGPIGGSTPASEALWNHPTGIAFAADGTFAFAAWHNSRVIGVDPVADAAWLIAGTGARDFDGDGADALLAAFDLPSSVAYGPDGSLFVSDQANQRVRRITDGIIDTVVGQTLAPQCTGADVEGCVYFCGDGGDPLDACLFSDRSQDAKPAGRIAFDADGRLVIADTNNNRVRILDFDANTIDTLVGDGTLNVGEEGADALSVGLDHPRDVAVGPDGTVYITDTDHHCIRALRDGAVTTAVGTCGTSGFEGDRHLATDALLDQPFGMDVGPDGALWIVDSYNHRLRRVAPL
jgi:DNA-binding beta-propeller fold protein YncE